MKRYIIFVPILFFCLNGYGQDGYTKLRGKILDNKTNEPVPYASILIKNSNYGVVSNEEGLFELPLQIEFLKDSIEISSLGYKTFRTLAKNLAQDKFSIVNLKEKIYELDEVTIKALSPEEILRTAIKRIPFQFSGAKPLDLEYFYRGTISEEDKYVNLVECAFRLLAKASSKDAVGSFKLDYKSVRRSANFSKGPMDRPFITPNVIFQYYTPVNGIRDLLDLIDQKSWDLDFDYGDWDGELVYVVKATVTESHYPDNTPIRGPDWINNYVFYVRAKDHAILRIDTSLGQYAHRIVPGKIPSWLKLSIGSQETTVIFKELDGRFYPHFYQVLVEYSWYQSKSEKLIVNGSQTSEAIVQDKTRLNKQVGLPLIPNHKGHSIPFIEHNPTFWNGYVLKDQIPTNPKVARDLESYFNVLLEDQFEANSRLWNPKSFKQVYKGLKLNPPKATLEGNISFHLPGFGKAKFVSVVGDFNAWNPVKHFFEKNEKGWNGKMNILPGKYKYQLIVDGKRIIDPTNMSTSKSGKNSILIVE